MCSRYFLDADGNVIAYTFRVPVQERVRRRYNIAPTQEAPVVRAAAGGAREAAMLRWGLVPAWAKELAVGTRMINARAEGVEAKPAFRAAIRQRRCLVPASGFFEWKGVAGRKQPFAIRPAGRELFAFAGLWETWKPADGAAVETFTIITTEANEAVAAIHDRMPVILPREAEDAWLEGNPDEARALLKPYAGDLELRAVRSLVSNVRNDVPECLDDAEPGWGAQQSLL
jgi:putative SOS response-associated peptidase YedK